MNTGRGFVVPFVGLSTGSHSFKFEIDSSFFESFEYFENVTGKLSIVVDLLKESNMLIFNFEIKGKVNLLCDRCLSSLSKNIEGLNKLIVKFGDSYMEVSDDVIVIPVSDNRINLKQHIFEFISLLIPFRNVHPNDKDGYSGCNSDIIDRINKYSKQEEDPRWDALKGLKI